MRKQTNKQPKRIEWVDIARGIAIIFMVMGHTSIPVSLSKYIWSFHMPLFFLVSGLFFDEKLSFKNILLKRLYTLIIPYVFFTIIVFCGYIGTEYYKPHELLYGWEGYALWFVPVLFFADLVFFFISSLRYKLMIPVVLGLTALGKLLSLYSVSFPFKIEVVPFAIFFIASGFICKQIIFHYKPSYITTIAAGIVTIMLSQVLPKLGMGRNEFGIIVPNLFNALLGIFFIFSVSMHLAKWINTYGIKCINWFGRNSLFVMAFSQLFNYWILTGLQKSGLPQIVALPLRYLILFSAIYVAAKLLMRYTPFLVGKNYGKYCQK